MALERTITNNIIKYLNNLPNCIAEKVSGDIGQSGRADINGCFNGQSFRIEVKTPDNYNKPTIKQLLNLAQWGKAGAVTFVAYSLEDVKQVLMENGCIRCIRCKDVFGTNHFPPCSVRYCRWKGVEWKPDWRSKNEDN